MRHFFILLLLFFTVGPCSTLKPKVSDVDSKGRIRDVESILSLAEKNATPEAKAILITGRAMVKTNKVIRGSCWDYVNAVYNKSGFKAKQRISP
jgi:hypothetical protein